jgi:hypothetical protein
MGHKRVPQSLEGKCAHFRGPRRVAGDSLQDASKIWHVEPSHGYIAH